VSLFSIHPGYGFYMPWWTSAAMERGGSAGGEGRRCLLKRDAAARRGAGDGWLYKEGNRR
jgi:hypothetical protein